MPHGMKDGVLKHTLSTQITREAPSRAWDTAHMPTISENLTRLMDEHGIGMKPWSVKAGLGETAVRDIIKTPGRHPRFETLQRLADALGIDVAEITVGPGAGDNAAPTPAPNIEFRPNLDPPAETASGVRQRSDLPVYSSAQGGPDGMVIRYEAIDWIERPAALRGMRDAFAFHVIGDSMSPRYDEGERVLVGAPRPGRPGEDLLIILANGDDEVEFAAMVKRLVRQNSQEIVVEQFNPVRQFAIPRARIKQIFPVYGRL